MIEFLMSSETLLVLLGLLKAVAVCMFALNVGVILTWVERRARGMIQDAIGPNRAGFSLPGKTAAIGLAAGPAITAAGAVLGLALLLNHLEVNKAGWGLVFAEGFIFVTWFTLAAIARVANKAGATNAVEAAIAGWGSPRGIALTGVGFHVGLLVMSLWVDGTEFYADFVDATFWGGAGCMALMIAAGGGHVASHYWGEKSVRVTLLGLLHPAADGIKTALKADFIPPKGDWLMYNLAPWLALLPSLVLLAIVPFGPNLCFGTSKGIINFNDFQGIESVGNRCLNTYYSMQVADLNVGLLYFFAIAGTGIVGAALAGWASDNKFSLLGGMRAASQMVSYEVTLGLTVIGALMVYGSIRVDEMILWQAENAWGIFVQPFAFFLFIAAAIAETKRIPFDLPEGESEIVAGYYTEYAGMKFSMFFFSEFIAVVSSSTIMAALFLGGWHLPFVTAMGIDVTIMGTQYFSAFLPFEALAVIGVLAFIGKVLALCLLQVVIRWTLPRFRYDQLMRLGWRKLLPASLFNIMVTATIILAIQASSEQMKTMAQDLAQLSMVLLALGGVVGAVAFVIFLFAPVKKQRLVVNSAARYAELMGGTREAKMEA